jgi:hypothetical protein
VKNNFFDLKSDLFIIFYYVLLFILFSYPLSIFDYNNCLIGFDKSVDLNVFLWEIETFKKNFNLFGFSLKFFNSKEAFYPYGVNIISSYPTHLYNIVNLFFANKYLTINIITGLSFVSSGYLTFVFSKKILNSFFLAFLTGFIFSFQPFIQSRLYVGHYNLILTFTIPLFLINLFNFFFKNNKWNFKQNIITYIKLIFLYLLIIVCDFYYAYYIALLFIFLILFNYFKINYYFFTFKKVVVKILLFVIVSSIFYHLVNYFLNLNIDFYNYIPQSKDFISNRYSIFSNNFNQFNNEHELNVHFEYIVLALFFLSIFKININQLNIIMKTFLWLMFCYLLLIFPLFFKVEKTYLFASPSYFLYNLPIIKNFRVPSRAFILVLLFVTIFSFKFFEPYYYKLNFRNKIYLSILVFLFILIEYIPHPLPIRVDNKNSPEEIIFLKNMPNGSLLILPFGVRDGKRGIGDFNPIDMYYQTIHNKPILGGYTARVKNFIFDSYINEKALKLFMENNTINLSPTELDTFLIKYNIKYILLRNEIGNYHNLIYLKNNLNQKWGLKIFNNNYIYYNK